MATINLPSPEVLNQLLDYEPETGALRWKARTPEMFSGTKYSKERVSAAWNKKNSGKPVGNVNCRHGYVEVVMRHNGVKIRPKAHRLVYAMHTGNLTTEVDHINGIRSDNRIENLRATTRRENSLNKRQASNNKSGFGGVGLIKSSGKWRAFIDGQHLGCFEQKFDAILCRLLEERDRGYTRRHGLAA